ncbi:hypothetical protein BH24ACT15_BH24ACT15_33530 [soil metagenome]
MPAPAAVSTGNDAPQVAAAIAVLAERAAQPSVTQPSPARGDPQNPPDRSIMMSNSSLPLAYRMEILWPVGSDVYQAQLM